MASMMGWSADVAMTGAADGAGTSTRGKSRLGTADRVRPSAFLCATGTGAPLMLQSGLSSLTPMDTVTWHQSTNGLQAASNEGHSTMCCAMVQRAHGRKGPNASSCSSLGMNSGGTMTPNRKPTCDAALSAATTNWGPNVIVARTTV
jgi:hypothetical protein